MIAEVITLAEQLAAKPDAQKATYKQVRDADGKFIFTDTFQDCSEFIYFLLHEKYKSMYDDLAVDDSGNTTTLKTQIESIGGTFSATPVAPSLAIWWDTAAGAGSHVELVVKVEKKPVVIPHPQDYRITNIGARGAVGNPVPHKLITQSLASFTSINPKKLLGFWNIP